MAGKKGSYSFWSLLLLLGFVILPGITALADDAEKTSDEDIKQLKQTVQELAAEVGKLKEEKSQSEVVQAEYQQELKIIREDVNNLNETSAIQWGNPFGKLSFGGYGELHANFIEGSEKDQFDIHRLVLYVGYDFEDWIRFNSELEIEHAYVNDGNGYAIIEQAYFDFLLNEKLNVRAGRLLTPVGITNKWHEPTLFNGVERPSFDRVVIPTTWSSDGIGFFGRLNPEVTYEAYFVAGLDGSKFNALNGIRDGRIKERPSLNEPAVTGRLDFHPFMSAFEDSGQSLRLGLSGYFGGLDNGNRGNNPGINGEISLVSADFEYSVSKFDFRGAIATIDIDGAREIGNGTAEQIFGWYLEGGYHFWPESWKTGKLAKSDAVAFVRYDNYDTQYKMPSGIARNPAGDRQEWTFGVNFYPTSNVVIKVDYQIRDATGNNLNDLFNLGIGWVF